MKNLNIISIGITVIFIAVIFYYLDATLQARSRDWMMMDLDYYSWDATREAPKITFQAGLVTLLFFLFYVFINISNMVKIKTKTTRVLSIIGISLNGIIILWDFVMISSPSHISFDEVAGAWLIFAVIILAFSIVFLVQSTRKIEGRRLNPEVIDDMV